MREKFKEAVSFIKRELLRTEAFHQIPGMDRLLDIFILGSFILATVVMVPAVFYFLNDLNYALPGFWGMFTLLWFFSQWVLCWHVWKNTRHIPAVVRYSFYVFISLAYLAFLWGVIGPLIGKCRNFPV